MIVFNNVEYASDNKPDMSSRLGSLANQLILIFKLLIFNILEIVYIEKKIAVKMILLNKFKKKINLILFHISMNLMR